MKKWFSPPKRFAFARNAEFRVKLPVFCQTGHEEMEGGGKISLNSRAKVEPGAVVLFSGEHGMVSPLTFLIWMTFELTNPQAFTVRNATNSASISEL